MLYVNVTKATNEATELRATHKMTYTIVATAAAHRATPTSLAESRERRPGVKPELNDAVAHETWELFYNGPELKKLSTQITNTTNNKVVESFGPKKYSGTEHIIDVKVSLITKSIAEDGARIFF